MVKMATMEGNLHLLEQEGYKAKLITMSSREIAQIRVNSAELIFLQSQSAVQLLATEVFHDEGIDVGGIDMKGRYYAGLCLCRRSQMACETRLK